MFRDRAQLYRTAINNVRFTEGGNLADMNGVERGGLRCPRVG
jgi:hypothetical protein